MKVLYIIDTLNGSGAERSLAEIAIHLKEFRPVFVHVYPGNMLVDFLQSHGIKVYSLNINEKYGYKTAVEQLAEIYKTESPDIIHSTLYKSDRIARMLKSRFREIPLIGSFVNNSYTPLRYKNQSFIMKIKLYLAYQMDKQSAKKVDFFISNSETIKKSEGGALSIPSNKIKVIYRGRDLSRFENLNSEKIINIKEELDLIGKNVLLNVSRLIPRKGQADLIEALPKIVEFDPTTVLVFAGHGVLEKSLREKAETLNVGNNVRFLGRRTDIPELLEIASLFLYPSYAEGLPGALIEAMLAQKIIIASDIGENMECVNEKSALIFNMGNVQELAGKILYALKNKEKLKYLADNARQQGKMKFEINSIASQYDKTYQAVINENSANA